jgi:hypothetical protein
VVAFLKKYRTAILSLLVVTVLLYIGFILVARWAVNDLFASSIETPNATQYAAWVGIWLPDDVQKFQSYGEGWQDWLVEARFELSASQFAAFLERNNLERIASQTIPESSYKLDWFSSNAKLESYELKPLPDQAAQTSTGFYPSVWMDTSLPEKVIVYIKAFDM